MNRMPLVLVPALLAVACQRPEVEAFRRAPAPVSVALSVPGDVPGSEGVSREYAAALRARLATRVVVVPEGVQPPPGAAELQVTLVSMRPDRGEPSPGAVGVATGLAVGTLGALAGNRNAVFDGFWWGLWAGTHAAAAQRHDRYYERDRLGYRPLRVNAVVHFRLSTPGGREWLPLAEFEVGGREVVDAMAPLGAADRDDPYRIREEEARAFSRVVVRKLEDRFEWRLQERPSFYGAADGRPAEPPPAPVPAPLPKDR